MSFYWTGYHGAGLVLDEEEFSEFLQAYCSATDKENMSLEQLRAYEEGYVDLREVKFNGSNGEGRFCALHADDDCCQGFKFYPFKRPNGTMNTEWEESEKLSGIEPNLFVFDSDKGIDSMNCFVTKSYDSYEDFVNEFRGKMARYLPMDFDWDAHLGFYEYACYA